MTFPRVYVLRLVACSLPFLASCQGSSGSTSTPSTLSQTLANVTDLMGSSDSAAQTAQACFDDYQACLDAGIEEVTCQETLEACLPAQAPLPSSCEGDAGSLRDRDGQHDEHADHARLADGGAAGQAEHDADDQHDEHAVDAGAEHTGKGAGHHAGGRTCGRPESADAPLAACRDEARTGVAGGMNGSEASRSHRTCMESAFSNSLGALCTQIDVLCAQTGADATACSDAKQTCSDAQGALGST